MLVVLEILWINKNNDSETERVYVCMAYWIGSLLDCIHFRFSMVWLFVQVGLTGWILLSEYIELDYLLIISCLSQVHYFYSLFFFDWSILNFSGYSGKLFIKYVLTVGFAVVPLTIG